MKGFLKYHIKDRWELLRQTRNLRGASEVPILVFTMAKVGSLSVYNALKNYGSSPVFHIHSLDAEAERKHIAYCFEKGVYPGSRTPVFLIQDEILKPEKPYKVISLFRDPIERNLSAFFDAFHIHVGMAPQDYSGSMQELEAIFHESLNHHYAIGWYGKQFAEGTGIDVYEHPFDTAEGHMKIITDQVEVLLLKSTLEDSVKEELIGAFAGLDSFRLSNVNVTAQSKSGELYRRFLDHMRFSEAYVNTQLNSRYAQHFFTPEERTQSKEKWAKSKV